MPVPVPSFHYDDGGTPVIGVSTEANGDWLRAARLLRAAEKGDRAVREELERMHNTRLVILTEAEIDAYTEAAKR